MLTITNMSKLFGERVLFEDVSIQINRGDRAAVVGANGAGKSTLFSLILGADVPDTGAVAIERKATIGHLPQETAPIGDETVLQLATAITPQVAELQRRMKAFDAGHGTDDHDFHEVQEEYDAIGGYQLEPRAKTILRGLAFRDSDFDRPLKAMSGGWIMRAHLARLLVQQPDLLMLDEPTNHLDLESLCWFQGYLMSYPGAILMISHDREFLNALAGSILDIRQRKVRRYRGNYDEYLVQRDAQAEQLLSAYKSQQKEIEKLQEFADRFRAKASKASQAQAKLKQIDRMDKIEAPERDGRTIKFRFPQPVRSGRIAIHLKDIHHAYGDMVVYKGMHLDVERGQRIVLVGPNGAGKSTLLKILAGVLPVQSGTRELGLHVKTGYYAQHRVEMLQPNRTVLEEASDTPQPLPEQFVRTVLGSFLFTGDNVYKQVSVLSGGEKSRLALVKLLLDPPNLLLMDEPTTHLDMASIDALIAALETFEGTLIFISHDVYFIRKLAKLVLHVDAGKLRLYHGDYQYYLDKTSATSAKVALTTALPTRNAQPVQAPAPRPSVRTKEQKREEAEARNARSRERRNQQHLVDKLEKEIARLEALQAAQTAELEKPETYQDAGRAVALNRELSHTVEDLARATAEWEAAATRLSQFADGPTTP
ncbi:MAG TPA: ABC transporter ATP-binding protein [Verrucomicrobia bacterium]|nr:MAG: ABC transporter ATP-binding protein [Lentisphaerae bacterium GWF2_57_35]HBA85547.1 ABC transporter ATP-binding protein [Verrucomicrobiota bacterium]